MRRMKVVSILGVLPLLGLSLLAQSEMPKQMPMKPGAEMKMDAMPADCKAMMERHEAMQARMKEMDDRLDRMVVAMNAARGSAKVDRTAEVVQELVAQRTQMRGQMASMMPMMMQHMGGHMQQGMKMMHEGMEHCPMMQAKPEGDAAQGHEKHH